MRAMLPFVSTIPLTNEQRERLWRVRLARFRKKFKPYLINGGCL